jgi:hypothetical protein
MNNIIFAYDCMVKNFFAFFAWPVLIRLTFSHHFRTTSEAQHFRTAPCPALVGRVVDVGQGVRAAVSFCCCVVKYTF